MNEQEMLKIEEKTERRWIISDLHFFHKKIIEYENRPFKTVQEMNKEIIQRWNSVVGKNDLVYFLGDFALSWGNKETMVGLVHSLNGRKIMIQGNHDTKKPAYYISIGFLWSSPKPILINNNVILMHQPPMPDNCNKDMIYIYGHTHTNWCEVEEFQNCFNVSCERLNYTPLDLDELVAAMKNNQKEEIINKYHIRKADKNWGRTN